MDERVGRRARASVPRGEWKGRRIRARRSPAGHLHDRSVAREARHADADGHHRRERIQDDHLRIQDLMLHLFAVLVAAATGILIFAGGLVTSTESGLSVPDWPNTYGH